MFGPKFIYTFDGRRRAEQAERLVEQLNELNPASRIHFEVISWDPGEEDHKLPEKGYIYCEVSGHPARVRHLEALIDREQSYLSKHEDGARKLIASVDFEPKPVAEPVATAKAQEQPTGPVDTFQELVLEELLFQGGGEPRSS